MGKQMQTTYDRPQVPDYGAKANQAGSIKISQGLDSGEQYEALLQEVRDELRSTLTHAIAGKLSFVPTYTIDHNRIKSEKTCSLDSALVDVMAEQACTDALRTLLASRAAPYEALELLRQSIISAYIRLNADGIADARWERA